MWMWNDGWGHMGDWGWGWGIFGMLMMAAFWGGIILLMFYAFRSLAAPRDRGPFIRADDNDRGLAILRERYARGEIDREEFDARRRLLEDSARSP